MPRHHFRLSGAGGGAENRSPGDLLDLGTQALGPGAARGWIENHDGVFQGGRVKALVFSSNWESVTFRRAKAEPDSAYRARRDPGCGGPHSDWREHVCAVGRDTSQDSAGT